MKTRKFYQEKLPTVRLTQDDLKDKRSDGTRVLIVSERVKNCFDNLISSL